MKVAIIMFYDDNIKEYGEINYVINKNYCEKYGLDLIVSNNKLYNDRHSAWERLPLILKYIEQYDYLIWIDADAFFYNDSDSIINIINNNLDSNFIFSNDINNNNINTGFFIVKNNEYSINFIKKWAYDEELYNANTMPLWWDQGVLNDMYNENLLEIQNNSICYNYGILQHFYDNEELDIKPFILHMAGTSKEYRIDKSLEYYNLL